MREFKEILILIIGLPFGIWAIYASWKNKASFFNSARASIFVSIFGRTGARIFYGLIGLLMLFAWVMVLKDFLLS